MVFPEFFMGMSDSGMCNMNQNKYAYMRHVNPWNKLGMVECEWAMKSDDLCKNIEPGIVVTTPSGQVFVFSTVSGNVYLRESGKCRIVHDNGRPHRGATYSQGNVFYTLEDGNTGYSPVSPTNFQGTGQVTAPGTQFVPYYTDLARVWFGIGPDMFNSEILPNGNVLQPTSPIITGANLPLSWQITDITSLDDDLVWGAWADNQGAIGQYRRYADSFHGVDDMDSPVATFFGSSNTNVKFAIVGHEGQIFHIQGSQAVLRYQIPCVKTFPNPYLDAYVDGRAVVGVGGRIYSYHQKASGHPFALVHSYTCTGGDDAVIVSLDAQENVTEPDQLFASWYHPDGRTGLDVIDYENRAEGLIVTAITSWNHESAHDERHSHAQVSPKTGFYARYLDLPRGTSLEIAHTTNMHIKAYADAIGCDGPKDCAQGYIECFGDENCNKKNRMHYKSPKKPCSTWNCPETGEEVKMLPNLIQGHISLIPCKDKSPILYNIELL